MINSKKAIVLNVIRKYPFILSFVSKSLKISRLKNIITNDVSLFLCTRNSVKENQATLQFIPMFGVRFSVLLK